MSFFDRLFCNVDMEEKYDILIAYLLSGDPRARILGKLKGFISIGLISPGGNTTWNLTLDGDKLLIDYSLKNSPLIGSDKLHFSFPANQDQEEIIIKLVEIMQRHYEETINKLGGL